MITDSQREKLKQSWGEKAEAMQCYAQVRVYDPSSLWECYIYALNPENDDECMCIIKVSRHVEPSIARWYLTDISLLFNENGDGVSIDTEYRPMRAAELWKKLNEEKQDEY